MLLLVDPHAIRRARESAGLTQHQLAHAIGMAGGERISKWELGTATPRLEILARLAHALGVDIETLLTPGSKLTGMASLRANRALSVSEAARLCHVSVATYERWEKGQTVQGPAGGSLSLLAQVMHVTEAEAETALQQSRQQR